MDEQLMSWSTCRPEVNRKAIFTYDLKEMCKHPHFRSLFVVLRIGNKGARLKCICGGMGDMDSWPEQELT